MLGNHVAGLNRYRIIARLVTSYSIVLLLLVIVAILPLQACTTTVSKEEDPTKSTKTAQGIVMKSRSEWKDVLSEEQFRVTRDAGTERAFTGKYWNTKTQGTYNCVSCGNPLFSSESKFESGSGWPSFFKPLNNSAVAEKSDVNFAMKRTEVLCSKCDAHLGHVFEDGPEPTGLRYCLNSVALDLVEGAESK